MFVATHNGSCVAIEQPKDLDCYNCGRDIPNDGFAVVKSRKLFCCSLCEREFHE